MIDNGPPEVDSVQGTDTNKTSTHFSLPTTKDTSTERHTSDDSSTTNNGSSNKDISNTSPLIHVPPIERESHQKSFDATYTSKSDNNEPNKVSPTDTPRPAALTNKESLVESPSNKVLSTAKKLETTAERVEVRNLKTFGTIKKAASSVTDLKSTFKKEIDTNTRNVHSAKSSFHTISKDSPKISETEKTSLTVIDEAKVVERKPSIDLTSRNHTGDNEPIGSVKQSTDTPRDTSTVESADPTSLTKAAANVSLSSVKGSSEMFCKNNANTAASIKKESDTESPLNHDVFEIDDVSIADDNKSADSFVSNTITPFAAPLGKEDSTTLEAKANTQPSLFAVKEEKLDSTVSRADENLSKNTPGEYSDNQKPSDGKSDLAINCAATKSGTNIPSTNETASDTIPALEAKNYLESNQNVSAADMPLKTTTPTAMTLNNKTSQAASINAPGNYYVKL